jgi:hypothetical protein
MNLIVLDKETQTSVVIEIGDQGYEIFRGKRVLQDSQEQPKASQKDVPQTAATPASYDDKQSVIAEIRRYAYKLGRTPRAEDMSKKKGTVPISVLKKYFGTHNKAMEAAGLYVNSEKHKKQ